MFAACTTINASSFMKNGELKLVDDKEYITRCIMGYKWIQFIEQGTGRGGTYYVLSGNPQQMFIIEGAKMFPLECDK